MTASRHPRLTATKFSALALLATTLLAAPTAATAATTTTTTKPPAYTFVDNFDGTRLDPTRWTAGDTATNWSGIGSGTCHQASNARVANGQLLLSSKVTAQPFTCRYPNGTSFQTRGSSAEVHTKGTFAQTYGTWEIRARFPADTSFNASGLWMYPEQETYGAWPRSGEIDIVERMPWAPNTANNSLHYLDSSGGTSFSATDGDGNPGETKTCAIADAAQWHVYGVTWTRTQTTFTVDGKVCSTMGWTPKNLTNPAPFDHPFFTLLRQQATVSDTSATQTRTTVVDWVRVTR